MRKKYLATATLLVVGLVSIPAAEVTAANCPDLKIIYIRGSGATLENDGDWTEFQKDIGEKVSTLPISFEFEYLDYPAVSVGLDHLDTAVGAFVSGGESFEFGASVKRGTSALARSVNNPDCPGTKYVIAGYSQGAIVLDKALPYVDNGKVIYAATFGDPKIYLPEGAGIIPQACFGKNLSAYRIYVPNCMAYKGLLGSTEPYVPSGMGGKIGTWCNKNDIMCSSGFSIDDHTHYASDGVIEDIARRIFYYVKTAFGVESDLIASPHDTLFLFDSTGSMGSMLSYYKTEAIRLATKTIQSGGRVALYDYRDLADPYIPVQRCNFDNCTLERFTTELNNLEIDGGGDTPESLLSAAKIAMNELNWQYGHTKSLVVLTDAPYHSPDLDGTTEEEIVNLSKSIDPVNFYIITDESSANNYEALASDTGGNVMTDFGKLELLTDYIMERYDSLPRVEEGVAVDLPTLKMTALQINATEANVGFSSEADKVIVMLDDMILGVTTERSLTFQKLTTGHHVIGLAPVKDDVRGKTMMAEFDIEGASAETEIGDDAEGDGVTDKSTTRLPFMNTDTGTLVIAPKAPNTGRG